MDYCNAQSCIYFPHFATCSSSNTLTKSENYYVTGVTMKITSPKFICNCCKKEVLEINMFGNIQLCFSCSKDVSALLKRNNFDLNFINKAVEYCKRNNQQQENKVYVSYL